LGKGRKERVAPLTRQTVAVLKIWTRERGGYRPTPCSRPGPADR